MKSKRIQVVIFLLATMFLLNLVTAQAERRDKIDYSRNFIENGDFQSPQVDPSLLDGRKFDYYEKIPGWQGQLFELGKATVYSKYWLESNGQVMDLDVHKNEIISQKVKLQKEGEYLLQFEWAPSWQEQQPEFRVLWNGKVILHRKWIYNVDPFINIQHSSLTVHGDQGLNILQFQSLSESNGYGMTVDNVELYRIIPKDEQIPSKPDQNKEAQGEKVNFIDFQEVPLSNHPPQLSIHQNPLPILRQTPQKQDLLWRSNKYKQPTKNFLQDFNEAELKKNHLRRKFNKIDGVMNDVFYDPQRILDRNKNRSRQINSSSRYGRKIQKGRRFY